MAEQHYRMPRQGLWKGGIKDTAKWQESEELAPYVKLLIDTSRFISSRMSDGSLVLVDKEKIGNLNFTRNEEE